MMIVTSLIRRGFFCHTGAIKNYKVKELFKVMYILPCLSPAYAQAQKMMLGGTGIMRRESETDREILRQSQFNDDEEEPGMFELDHFFLPFSKNCTSLLFSPVFLVMFSWLVFVIANIIPFPQYELTQTRCTQARGFLSASSHAPNIS